MATQAGHMIKAPKPPTYKKGGYHCKHCGAPYKRPQELGVHVRTAHARLLSSNNANHHADGRSTSGRAAPVAAMSRPMLLEITTASGRQFYLIDADDATRMTRLEHVIHTTTVDTAD